jgi:hypothetical protein
MSGLQHCNFQSARRITSARETSRSTTSRPALRSLVLSKPRNGWYQPLARARPPADASRHRCLRPRAAHGMSGHARPPTDRACLRCSRPRAAHRSSVDVAVGRPRGRTPGQRQWTSCAGVLPARSVATAHAGCTP